MELSWHVLTILAAILSPISCLRYGQMSESLHVPFAKEEDYMGSGFTTIVKEEFDGSEEVLSRVRRQVHSPIASNITHQAKLNDSHLQMIIHWAGQGSDVIVAMTRDLHPTTNSTSCVYISKDYGYSFKKKTLVLSNNQPAIIDKFYNSKVYNTHYVFADVINQALFTTTDYADNVTRHSLRFSPRQISFHKTNPNLLLAYDEEDYHKKLYVSHDFGSSWEVMQYNVKSFFWGDSTYDQPNTLYVERSQSGRGSILRSHNLFRDRGQTILYGVSDFQLVDNFMFATKQVYSHLQGRNSTFHVSHNRRPFLEARFPVPDQKQDYYVADASENQVFLCVYHNASSTHLYISGINGSEFALSMRNIVYFNPKYHNNTLVGYFASKPFADIYRVEGLRGIYVASRFTTNNTNTSFQATDNQVSMITVNKGASWNLISAPLTDSEGNRTHCTIHPHYSYYYSRMHSCSLHLAQNYHLYHPMSRTVPLMSKESAVGLVMATGSLGQTFSRDMNVFMSTNGGLNWREVLKGLYLYAFGDHGGLIVAVKKGELTSEIFYSHNEGETWQNYEFSTKKVWIYGVLSEPGEKTTIFSLFGSEPGAHQWIIIKVNLRSVLEGKCGADDYKNWSPTDSPTVTCLLGQKIVYQRRRAHALCYNGRDFVHEVSVQNCPCSRADYECDIGFVNRGWFAVTCEREANSTINIYQMPVPCPAGTFYHQSKGYRRIAGDLCEAGQAHRYDPLVVACPDQFREDFILYTTRTAVYRHLLARNRTEQLQLYGLRNVLAVEYDYSEDCIYWADTHLDSIQRMCFGQNGNRSQVTILSEHLDNIEGLALDWMSRTLFFVDAANKSIHVVRTDGSHRRQLINSTHLDKPRSIALSPKLGIMFWSDWSDSRPRIMKAWMDGSHIETFYSGSSLHWPNGLTIDEQQDRLYWADAYRHSISYCSMTRDCHTLVTDAFSLPHPYAISVYKENLYWTDWTKQAIMVANKHTGRPIRRYISGLNDIMDMKIMHLSVQQGSSQCSTNNGNCPSLCLERPNNVSQPQVTCLCSDKFVHPPRAAGEGNEQCLCPHGEVPAANHDGCSTGNGTTCAPNQHMCTNYKCIATTWLCDYDNDCGDNSDELNCPPRSCSHSQFGCRNGRCVPSSWKCDHDNDCGDNSDEDGPCSYTTCLHSQFTCENGRCISGTWKCDGDDDCHDGSDENSTLCQTKTSNTTCPINLFHCNNGLCISQAWYCDDMDDCGDGSDELGCNSTSTARPCDPLWQLTCDDGSCVSNMRRCDGVRDCPGGTDEHNCRVTTPAPPTPGPTPHTCDTRYHFRCMSGQCIYLSQQCDGDRDCPRGEDEWNCRYSTTSAAPCDWRCDNSFQCIDHRQVCDGHVDCYDHSDESRCDATTPASCPSNAFRCGNGMCIQAKSVCDGYQDCLDGEDERNCGGYGGHCQDGEIECLNSPGCVKASLRCNGIRDCVDGSDESDCYTSTVPSTLPSNSTTAPALHCRDEFTCTDGECLPYRDVCDGRMDCMDGSDETVCAQPGGISYYTVTFKNQTAVSISWDGLPAIHTNYTGVRVMIGSRGADGSYNWQDTTLAHLNQTTVQFTGLTPWTTYYYTVQAVMKHYNAPYMQPRKVTTNEGRPSAPQKLVLKVQEVGGFGRMQLSVTWDAPERPNGQLTQFNIYYNDTSRTGHTKIQQVVLPPGLPQKTYHALLNTVWNQVQYTIWVTAVTDIEGPQSEKMQMRITLPGHPACVLNVGSEATLGPGTSRNIFWVYKSPTVDDIDYYQVTWFSLATLEFHRHEVTKGSSYDVSFKSPGTTYSKFVVAHNKKGMFGGVCESSSSGSIHTTGTALQVTGLTVHQSGVPPVVQVKWNAPAKLAGFSGDWKPVYTILYDSEESKLMLHEDKALTYSGLISEASNVTTQDTHYMFHNLVYCARHYFDVYVRVGEVYGIAQRDSIILPPNLKAAPKNVAVGFGKVAAKTAPVIVQWSAPCDFSLLPVNLNYMVIMHEVFENGTRGIENGVLFNATQNQKQADLTMTVPKQKRGATYNVSVQVYNPSENPRRTIPLTFTVAPYAGPVNLVAIPKYEEESCLLMWQAPPANLRPKDNTYVVGVYHAMGPGDATQMSFTLTLSQPGNTSMAFLTQLQPAQIHHFKVRYDNIYGYPSTFSKTVTAISPDYQGPAPPSSQDSGLHGPMLAAVIVPCVVVILVLAVLLTTYIIRHRRLQSSFLSFANSHYDTRSGRTRFSGADDLDEDDQPMIQGFSDDEPLIIA